MDEKAYVEIRSQKARGSWPRQGPDTYVAVQIVPEGVEPLRSLNRRNAELRGIEIRYFGSGYSRNQGPRSALHRAIREANEFAARINVGPDAGPEDYSDPRLEQDNG